MQYARITFFTLLLQSTALLAQNDNLCDHSHHWWLNLGFGIGSAPGEFANNLNGRAASQISFNGMITNNVFMTLAWTGIYHHHSFYNDDEARDVALMLGYKSKKTNWYWSAATGVGVSHFETQYKYIDYRSYYRYTETQSTFAVPVEGQLFWTPFKHFGIGLIGHASVSKNPFATAMIALQFS